MYPVYLVPSLDIGRRVSALERFHSSKQQIEMTRASKTNSNAAGNKLWLTLWRDWTLSYMGIYDLIAVCTRAKT